MKLKSSKKARIAAVGVLGLAASLAACNKKKADDAADPSEGGGNKPKVNDVDGVVTAGTLDLQLSDSLNLIPAKTTESAQLALSELDDAKAKVNYRVRELSTEGLTQVQGILCFLAQTRYAELANTGPYVALVNESRCFKDGDSNRGERITRVKIESVREEGKALIVKLWFAKDEHNEEGMHVILQVAEGASASNPVGIFRLQFGHGYIESRRNDDGEIEVVFYESQERPGEIFSMQMAVRLVVDEAGEVAGGRMVTKGRDKWGDQPERSSEFNVVFDENLINRAGTVQGEQKNACLDRNKHTGRAWNYNVFKADGSLLRLNSGFSIEFQEGGQTKQGYASFWGVSTNGGGGLPESVTEINKIDYSTGQKVSTVLNVQQAPGKLTKMTKKTITLGDLKGAELRQHGMGDQVIVKWNGSKFEKVAKVTWGENGEQRTPDSGEAPKDQWAKGWRFEVMSLGGSIFIPEDQANDSFLVSYFQRSQVSGTTGAPAAGVELVCFDRCIDAEPTAQKFQEQGWGGGASGPFITTPGFNNQDSNSAQNLTAPVATYTWDATSHNLVLKTEAGNKAFKLPSGLSNDSNQGTNHMTGALVPKSVWTALSDKQKSPYELEGLVDEYYTFESGTQNWSRFTALKNADGSLVQFDQPVNFTYVHSKENDLNKADASEFYGQTFSVQYGGAGNFWGIPWEKDEETGYSTPKFSIAVGAAVGSEGHTVVPSEVEQVLTAVDAAQCAGIPLEGLPELPTTPASPVDNGAEPSDDTPVKVNGGELTAG